MGVKGEEVADRVLEERKVWGTMVMLWEFKGMKDLWKMCQFC